MPESEKPASSSTPPAPAKPAAGFSGNVPITEEFDRAKWTLPAAVPVTIAVVVVAIVVALVVFVNRSKPSASGSITRVAAAPQADSVMVGIQLKFDNVTDNRLWIKSLKAEMEAADGQKFNDDAAPAVDARRYIEAFPVLAESKMEALKEEMRILPGGSQRGVIVVVFPVTQAVFDSRKSLTVNVAFYDHPGMVLRQ